MNPGTKAEDHEELEKGEAIIDGLKSGLENTDKIEAGGINMADLLKTAKEIAKGTSIEMLKK